MQHPWFGGFDFAALRQGGSQAPYVPAALRSAAQPAMALSPEPSLPTAAPAQSGDAGSQDAAAALLPQEVSAGASSSQGDGVSVAAEPESALGTSCAAIATPDASASAPSGAEACGNTHAAAASQVPSQPMHVSAFRAYAHALPQLRCSPQVGITSMAHAALHAAASASSGSCSTPPCTTSASGTPDNRKGSIAGAHNPTPPLSRACSRQGSLARHASSRQGSMAGIHVCCIDQAPGLSSGASLKSELVPQRSALSTSMNEGSIRGRQGGLRGVVSIDMGET